MEFADNAINLIALSASCTTLVSDSSPVYTLSPYPLQYIIIMGEGGPPIMEIKKMILTKKYRKLFQNSKKTSCLTTAMFK